MLNRVISGDIIQANIDDISSTGKYILTKKDTSSVSYRTSTCLYLTDATHPATVEITRLDLVNRVVSGRFAFTLETPGCDKVVVSEGRFDSLF